MRIKSLHQLPAPPADFTGREAKLDELTSVLTTGGVTIFLLHGMGGVGKTALALKLAERITPQYPDAQLYLDLRGTDPQPLVAAQVMAHVIHSLEPTTSLPETITELASLYRSVLNSKRALLLLDNAADCAQVEPLIPPSNVVLLVTSRRHFTLPGMIAHDLEIFSSPESCNLLLKIAPRIGERAPAIAELCGHLPIALRLAGSLLSETVDLTPYKYLDRLKDERTRLDLVDATFSLSYDLLPADLQSLWCSLSIFPATFDRPAVAAVLNLDPNTTENATGQLLRYNLVDYDAATSRYHLHDLARLFAADHLTSCLDEAEIHTLHYRYAAHYLAVLRTAGDLFDQGGEDILLGLALFDRERVNIEIGQQRAATGWLEDSTALASAIAFPITGAKCLHLRLHARERIAWLETSITIIRAASVLLEDSSQLRGIEGIILDNLGTANVELEQFNHAVKYYNQAIIIFREGGDRKRESSTLNNLGLAYRHLDELDRASELHEQALAIARETGDVSVESNALCAQGIVYELLGQNERAIESYQEAIVIAQKIGDRHAEGINLANLSNAYADLGQTEQAQISLRQALTIFEEMESPYADRAGKRLSELDKATSASTRN